MPRFIELNHPLEEGMPVYPGFPAARAATLRSSSRVTIHGQRR